MAEAPTGFEFNLHLPQNDDPNGLAEANLRTTVVRLPEGMTANPAFAAGLDACSSAEIGLTTPIGVAPPASLNSPHAARARRSSGRWKSNRRCWKTR